MREIEREALVIGSFNPTILRLGTYIHTSLYKTPQIMLQLSTTTYKEILHAANAAFLDKIKFVGGSLLVL